MAARYQTMVTRAAVIAGMRRPRARLVNSRGITLPRLATDRCSRTAGAMRQCVDAADVPNGYCPNHRTGVKLPADFAVTPLQYVD